MGSFGPAKTKDNGKNGVSKETQSLIDSMLKQTDMSHRQQKAMKAALTGQITGIAPVANVTPKAKKVAVPSVGRGSSIAPTPMPGRFSGIKLKSDIMRENPQVYNREQFTGGGNRGVDRELAKDQLAKTMEYNGRTEEQRMAELKRFEAKEAKKEKKAKIPDVTDNDAMVDEVLQSIAERQKFLDDMRALGQADAYEKQIKAEISTKLALLKRLGVDLSSGTMKSS